MSDSIWYKKIELSINEESEKLYKKDFKFYQVDTLLKLSKKIDSLSSDCNECKELKNTIEEVANHLSDYLKGDIASRKKYEKILNSTSNHLKKSHKIYPKQYNLYSYSFFGIIAGLGLGGLSWFFAKEYLHLSLLLGFTIGLITGRIIGKIKDNRLAQENRVY